MKQEIVLFTKKKTGEIALVINDQTRQGHPSSVGHVKLLTCDEAHPNRFMLLPANLRNHALPDRYKTVHSAKKKPGCSIDGGDGDDGVGFILVLSYHGEPLASR